MNAVTYYHSSMDITDTHMSQRTAPCLLVISYRTIDMTQGEGQGYFGEAVS
jgi:hypothetical protein